ncbi:cell division protein DivIC (FtsB), stabilizes FtsL against RasP cleavage [Tamlana sedimentorum]|uniref:Cell division protein DivIC (FtsB), stabilizes FtsL against RasP cleavage n=1 Tax=Neotamlana sedimentorum TaxID=1435349 RepID=A0A0D7WAR7_9FLAO|nr:DUF58 domain-containing protein [Tamlana sedimentorum]KJD35748.1 cell division protein DivIC (FtsB), stabilizes FtsL against RasP cleavage [Tamlana sedimentorum]
MKLFKPFYIQPRFFYAGIAIVVLFTASYFIPALFNVAQLLILALVVLFALDILIVFIGKNKIEATRELPDKFSNGDNNSVILNISNYYPFTINLEIIDEIPEQFQVRDFKLKDSIASRKTKTINYQLKPTERGEYKFGSLNVYASSALKIVAKRYTFNADAMVPTYPSFKQLKKFELLNINKNSFEYGLKKVRRLGHSMEFEQIKEYVLGDDLRTINWKATAKKNQLMVNQFQDEKSQPVYSIIDKGRIMKMPFNGLSLLDYAINAALVISNVVLKKQDKAGMFSFSKKTENVVVAERRNSQMQLILESLYNVKTDYFETDFSRLYTNLKKHVKQRSLLLMYTNFETLDGLERQLPYLKAIAKSHLLVVIFFKNTALNELINNKAETVEQVYDKVIAEKFDFEKRLIVNELKKYGIHSILTSPEHLTINTINKYLEVKARGLL